MSATVLFVVVLGCLCCSTRAGTVWPQPTNQSDSKQTYFVDGSFFKFEATGFESGILRHAFERYQDILFPLAEEVFAEDSAVEEQADGLDHRVKYIKALRVHVALNDQSLNLQTDESYVLDISSPESSLSANTVFGALHGLETFSQLLDLVEPEGVWADDMSPAPAVKDGLDELDEEEEEVEEEEEEEEEEADGPANKKHKKHHHKKHKKKHHKKKRKHRKKHKKHHHKEKRTGLYTVRGTYIWDLPRFQHRGLLIDTARHFLPVSIILDHLDAMAWSKLNVLHWHIVDDQSFPFVSTALPELSRQGAFSPDLIYTPQDVQQVVWEAKLRGIRVIPEFDTPGHTLSWGKGYPELLADCYDEKGRSLGVKGPLNPARNETFELLWALLQEVAATFPDGYLHLGGDEVPFDCWLNNPEIGDWMSDQQPPLRSMPAVEEYFERRVLDLAAAAGRAYVVWQDVLDNNVKVQADAIVHVWKWWWPVAEASAQQRRGVSGTVRSFFDRIWTRGKASEPHGRASHRALLEQQASGEQANGWECRLSSGCLPPAGADAETPGWVHEMERITSMGYRTLLSSPWYLNLGSFASNDWEQYYAVEPLGFQGTDAQRRLVIGGEACMWGEVVDATNSIPKTWPRAAAVAERLWSDSSVRDVDKARLRLEEHRCRMLERGIGAEPLGPGVCPGEAP